ncbi:MAG: hypothetical protein PVH87_20805 [Desulfobacteraceae bacterium]|jgi:hypothetical protein
MDPALCIRLVYSLAADEALAAASEFIEPAHLFLGTLKFAEIKKRLFETLFANPEHVEIIHAEQDGLRVELTEMGIAVPERCRAIRYALRQRIKQGERSEARQGTIHRSEASRRVCRYAAEDAASAGAGRWDAVHLLNAVLDNTVREISDILLGAGVDVSSGQPETPCLDRHGIDLCAENAALRQNHNPETAVAADPVCRVLLQILGAEKRANVLLVQKGRRTPEQVVRLMAAKACATPGRRSRKDKRRLIMLQLAEDTEQMKGVEPDELAGNLDAMFEEAVGAQNIILFLDGFERFLQGGVGIALRRLLPAYLQMNGVRFICSVTENGYHQVMADDDRWRQLLRPIWIHDVQACPKRL